jgi:transcriptional regulator with XRE-family HTH domain
MGVDGGARGALGDRLRHARLRRGSTREELAVQAGVSWSAIAQIESGRRRNVRPDTLAALARALEVTTDYLVDGCTSAPVMLTHQALVYGSDEEFANAVGSLLAQSLELGERTMLVTSDENVELVREFLGKDSRRIDCVSAADLYSEPDEALTTYQGFVQRALGGGAHWALIVGEPSWDGRSAAQARRWCRYESFLNLAFAALPVTVVCAYDERRVKPSILRQARETHPETLMEGTVVTNDDYVQPGGYVLGGSAGH